MKRSVGTAIVSGLLVVSSGCHRTAAKFTAVAEGAFSPETTFRELGYLMTNAPNQGVSNPVYLYRRHFWQGVLTVPKASNACEKVAVAIRDGLNLALQSSCHDELTGPGVPNPVGKSGRLLYLKDGMQGEVDVWLFGQPGEATVAYAIGMSEEKARN